jgi:DNA (cytosine-5)-methyltransferase 3A
METVLNNFCAEGLNVLSLFDGMSCGQLALQRTGIKVNQYYAAEIDKYAIQVTRKNFPNTIQLGDVTKVKGSDLPKIDLIIGGSPCQGFSFAGKGLNFEDERSKLFFEFVRLINECKPKYFFLENVKMKKEHELVISQYMKVAPIEINSALVSAQNRVRLYWTNINEKPYGLFGDMVADIPQPKDKGILLKDILESEVAEKFYLSEKMLKWLTKHSEKRGSEFKKLDGNQKESCLTTTEAKQNSSNDYICVASRGRNPENPKSRETGLNTEQMLEPRYDGKTNCITSVSKDNLVMQLNGSTESGGKQPYQQNRIYDTNGISPCLMAQMSCGTHAILEGAKIRRLTPTECERLQTVPDGYTDCVSDTQRYRMLGNGWTVDVIAHFFVFLKGEEKKII